MKPNENREIYKIEFLLQTKDKIEPPRPKRDIAHCQKYQRYGHTKKFCNQSSRCEKCAGNHLTCDCQRKEKLLNVRCILCEGNHPTNYHGCHI